ncbi:hypothetical protein CUMW_032280 [Citrus unshiu]|nr:hypothetical protein CUMW_032280 [Citrus unshiu]
MDDTTSTTDTKPDNKTLTVNTNERSKVNNKKGGGRIDDSDEEEYDAEAWNTLSKSFKQVQTVLDNNRSLIERVNDNHLSRIPDNNGNISKVVSIYSDLSANVCNISTEEEDEDEQRTRGGLRGLEAERWRAVAAAGLLYLHYSVYPADTNKCVIWPSFYSKMSFWKTPDCSITGYLGGSSTISTIRLTRYSLSLQSTLENHGEGLGCH